MYLTIPSCGCVIQKRILMEVIFSETDLFLNFGANFFQGLDLPNERMPPRKDAPATPEDSNKFANTCQEGPRGLKKAPR